MLALSPITHLPTVSHQGIHGQPYFVSSVIFMPPL